MARAYPLLLAALMALVVIATVPGGLIPLNDGFGYIRSIALTIQHGRAWTDDWLEPWAAGYSTLGALVFGGTGSMYLATYGLSALLMGVSAWAAHRLLVARGVAVLPAAAVTAALLLFPTLLWKFVEVNGFSLYFACLLLALVCHERRNWVGFALLWCLALSTRQSAVAWGILPAYAMVIEWTQRSGARKSQLLGPAVAIVVAAAFFLWLRTVMNPTHAQHVVTAPSLAAWSPASVVRVAPVLLFVLGVSIGLGSLIVGRRRDPAAMTTRVLAALGMLGVLGACLAVDFRRRIEFDQDAFQVPLFYHYLQALCVAGGIGLGLSALRVRLDYLLTAVGCALVLTLRGATWDYYLADVFVFGFFAAIPAPDAAAKRRLLPWAATALAVFSLAFVGHFKLRCDREYIVTTLGARALARGAIEARDASFLPFGSMGWYFFPHYATHEGKASPDLADFGQYLRSNAYGIAYRYPWPLRKLPQFRGTLPADHSMVVEQLQFRYFWFFDVNTALVRLPASGVRPARTELTADFALPTLPLTDAEWRKQLGR